MPPESRKRPHPDAGDSLVEILVAVTILTIAFAAILAGFATSVTASDYHKKQAQAEALIRNFAEHLTSTDSTDADAYQNCTVSSTPIYPVPSADGYPVGDVPATSLYQWTVAVSYWVAPTAPTTWTSTCPAAGDPGLQKIQITVSTSDGRVSETMSVLKRRL